MKGNFFNKIPQFFEKIGMFFVRLFNRCVTFFEKLFRRIGLFLQLAKTWDRKVWYAAGGALVILIAVVLTVSLTTAKKPADKPAANDRNTEVAESVNDAQETTMQIEVVQNHAEESKPAEKMRSFSIEVGESDAEIVPAVQERLMELDYMDVDEPTEEYSEDILVAVNAFQRRCGADVTGTLDNSTYNLLFSGAAPAYMAMKGDEGDDVVEIQTRLIELDYLKGSATGHFGDDTEAAVLKFQKNNKLTEDGKVGHNTKEAMYSDEVVPNYAAYGEESEEIKSLQQRLKALGYLTTEPDGKFGNDTLVAVKQFQVQHDLIADGWIGPQTKQLLNSGEAKYNTISIGMSGNYVVRIQERLKELKYLKSDPTGYFGSATQDAVAAFQKRNGLSQDGKVGKYTMTTLLSSKAKKAATTSTSNKNNNTSNKNNNSSSSNQKVDPPSYSGEASVSKLLQIAESRLGCKYVRGAKGPNKFDCSGFVYWCLNQTGVKVNYMTSATWQKTNKFKRITKFEDMKAGDIISMKGHVAIYAGNNMMYDASSGNKKVVYRASNRPWVKKAFVCAYRVFD